MVKTITILKGEKFGKKCVLIMWQITEKRLGCRIFILLHSKINGLMELYHQIFLRDRPKRSAHVRGLVPRTSPGDQVPSGEIPIFVKKFIRSDQMLIHATSLLM